MRCIKCGEPCRVHDTCWACRNRAEQAAQARAMTARRAERAALIAQAKQLHAEGLSLSLVSKRLGLGKTTVHYLLSDRPPQTAGQNYGVPVAYVVGYYAGGARVLLETRNHKKAERMAAVFSEHLEGYERVVVEVPAAEKKRR